MTTKAEFITQLKVANPTLRTGDDETGYTDLTPSEYDAKIGEWATASVAQEAQLAKETADANARTSDVAKAVSLGFSQAQAERMFP